MGTKQAEIDYPAKLNAAERRWLATKPFGSFNREESRRTFQDFSTLLKLIDRHQPLASNILELGCGPGWLSILLSWMGFRVTGYDISPAMIKVAKNRATTLKLERVYFGVADMETTHIKAEDGRHDVVIIYDALHHCSDEAAVINHCYHYLKPGGILLLAEPNRVHEHSQDAHVAVERFGVTERGFDVGTLRQQCRQAGFERSWRYHASGQSFEPRHEGLIDSLKMLIYPFLVRFYFGRTRTRIWFVAQKAAR